MQKLNGNEEKSQIIDKINEIIDFLNEKYGIDGNLFVDINQNVKEYLDQTGGMML